jgi:exoribonuclease R
LLPAVGCDLTPSYHCGIASGYYTRFAYPASRYGDLCVQRIIKAVSACGDDLSALDLDSLLAIATKAKESVIKNEARVKELEIKVSDLYTLELLNNSRNKIFAGTIWSSDNNQTEVLLDNGCKGCIGEIWAKKQDYVPGQRLNFRVYNVLWEKEMVVFEPLLPSQAL